MHKKFETKTFRNDLAGSKRLILVQQEFSSFDNVNSEFFKCEHQIKSHDKNQSKVLRCVHKYSQC